MSQAQTSIEVLLKARAQGLEQIRAIEEAVNRLSDASTRSAAASRAGADAANRQGATFAALAARARGAVFGVLGVGGVGLAIAQGVRAAAETQRAELRVLAILQGQTASRREALDLLERAKDAAASTARELGTFGQTEGLRAAASILSASPESASRLRKILTASANIAAATGQTLEQSAESVARSLAGVAPREIVGAFGELRREAERLGSGGFAAALRRGLLVDFGNQRLAGAATTLSNSDSGRVDAARRSIQDSLERLGDTALPLLAAALKAAARGASVFSAVVSDIVEGGVLGRTTEAAAPIVEGLARWLDSLLVELDPVLAARARRLLDLEAVRSGADLLGRGGARANPLPASGLFPEAAAQPRRRLLGNEELASLAAQQGFLDALTQSLSKVREQYIQLGATIDRDDPFKFIVDNAVTDADALNNLAVAQARLRDVLREAADGQSRFNEETQRARDLVEAGVIDQPKANALIQEAAERLRTLRDELNFLASIASGDAANALEFLRSLPDLPSQLGGLATIPELEQVPQALERLGQAADAARTRFSGLADEIRDRGRGPLAGFLEQISEGRASLLDLPDVFRRVLLQIAAEAAASRFLRGLFGSGDGKDFGVLGGLFNGLGGLLGFAEGGLVPGPDLGRDSTVIAARGGEYVVRPESVRRIGVPFLDALNQSFRGATPGASSVLPGYAAGGAVTRVASIATSSSGVTVLPVLVADRDQADRLLAGDNSLALADALGRRKSMHRARLGI